MRCAVHHVKQLALQRLLRIAVLWSGVAALSWPPVALAFGPSGHRVAAYVAERHLCPETREALLPLLAGMTLAEAGLWPDTIRHQPEWEHTRAWHYINVPDRGSVARAARRQPDNVLTALARFEKELGDTSLTGLQRGIALRFVAHLVVDIHQPLHVGRAEDRGGNRVFVIVAGRETNLHALWDAEPLRQPGSPPPRAWARSLAGPTAGEARRWQQASPVDWARESLALRRQVYGFAADRVPAGLPATYLAAARATVNRRLVQAGVRLAGRLNAVLAPDRSCAAEVASRQSNL